MISFLLILTLIYIHYVLFKKINKWKNRRIIYGSRISKGKRLYGYKQNMEAVHTVVQIDFSKVITIFSYVFERLGYVLGLLTA